MAHILFAAPALGRFHLHERLARALQTRGHRITVLCADPAEFAVWSHQGLCARLAQAGRPPAAPLPLAEFAAQDCLLADGRRPGIRRLERAGRPLRRVAGGILKLFEVDPPDLVMLHNQRTGLHRLIHFIGREVGSRILWTGDGLHPHTVQWDEEGLDGDSSICRRRALDYRAVDADEVFLAAAMAAFAGRAEPSPLSRSRVIRPPLTTRLAAALRSTGTWGRSPLAAVRAWRQTAAPPPPLAMTRMNVPSRPFLAVLLQDPTEPRVRLDAPDASGSIDLVHATLRAATHLDPTMPVVVVLPDKGLAKGDLQRLATNPRLLLEFSTALPEVVSTALAVTTINHPGAVGALLAGTPVLHLGRTPYGIRGVATRTSCELLTHDLVATLDAPDPSTLRQRFLTWLLLHGHLWCNPDTPDHNGLSGLIRELEDRLHRGPTRGGGLRYRAGPAWPLAAEPA